MDTSKIKVEKLDEVEGIFENDKGEKISYKNYYVYFTIGDNPLKFKAKVEKVYKEALKETIENELLDL